MVMLRAPNKEKQPKRGHRGVRKWYALQRWKGPKGLRRAILERDCHLCVICERKGITKPGNQVDHIQPAGERPDLFWVADNLQTLCIECHSVKTNKGQ